MATLPSQVSSIPVSVSVSVSVSVFVSVSSGDRNLTRYRQPRRVVAIVVIHETSQHGTGTKTEPVVVFCLGAGIVCSCFVLDTWSFTIERVGLSS